MLTQISRKRLSPAFGSMVYSIIAAFCLTLLGPLPNAQAQMLDLPVPGTMVNLSKSFSPAVLSGIKVNPANPLEFDFLIQPGDKTLTKRPKAGRIPKVGQILLSRLDHP